MNDGQTCLLQQRLYGKIKEVIDFKCNTWKIWNKIRKRFNKYACNLIKKIICREVKIKTNRDAKKVLFCWHLALLSKVYYVSTGGPRR